MSQNKKILIGEPIKLIVSECFFCDWDEYLIILKNVFVEDNEDLICCDDCRIFILENGMKLNKRGDFNDNWEDTPYNYTDYDLHYEKLKKACEECGEYEEYIKK